ncbi:MAG TPA: transketolase [Vicinamibacterales bacterium]|nr:transketolase [Vicinamibacterales bacterium]
MTSIDTLRNIATRLRMDSIRSTSRAGSGHPTTCLSAAEIMAALFFAEMRYEPQNPRNPHNDRFVLSKGHAAPVLYAAWAEAGLFPRDELLNLREIDSDLEGHPTPRLEFVDVATGSLGQGICAAVGTALNARRIGSDYRTYVLIGDGESSEGSVWEAAQAAALFRLDNLCGITDVNAYGQSSPTPWGHDTAALLGRWRAFGWHAIDVAGHDVAKLLEAFADARAQQGRPTMILARTMKGKGVSLFENKPNWHGKPLKRGEETDNALAELERQLLHVEEEKEIGGPRSSSAPAGQAAAPPPLPPPAYKLQDMVATREAYGTALGVLGRVDPRVVAMDADVKNSTYSERFEKEFPERFYQFYIAEQAMVGAAMGLAARGAVPFPSTFACFLARAADFIRMLGISNLDVKLAGSHAGVSIGEDGPSQMALEDLAMMRAVPNCHVLYPCDAVSTERLVALAARTPGPAYIRTTRPKTPVIYGPDEQFPLGGSKVLRESGGDAVTVVAAGVTVFEALKAHDALAKEGIAVRVVDAFCVQPIDAATLVRCGRATRGLIVTVEDHYVHGGLGDAVAEAVSAEAIAVHRLAVHEIPRSGRPEELLDRYGISARRIADTVRSLAGVRAGAR